VPREGLWQAQTPQMFRYVMLKRALETARQVTDEASAIEAMGLRPRLVQGRPHQPESHLSPRPAPGRVDSPAPRGLKRAGGDDVPFRIGQGFDVHALVPGRPLIIGGVTIPFAKGLLGHSDADVLLHTITDALLGAAGLGDIGRHFPDTDPRFEGADPRAAARGGGGGPRGRLGDGECGRPLIEEGVLDALAEGGDLGGVQALMPCSASTCGDGS
jgi:2-C-methyl-D-erythritol 4-phosphate cytidylyltransferase/2-C-methyl-D-erythritol 2,4-cyclodiphosphate synthase